MGAPAAPHPQPEPRTAPLLPAGGRAAPRLAPARARPGLAAPGGGSAQGCLSSVWRGLGDRLGSFPGRGRDLSPPPPAPAKHRDAAAFPPQPEPRRRGGCGLPRGYRPPRPTGPWLEWGWSCSSPVHNCCRV